MAFDQCSDKDVFIQDCKVVIQSITIQWLFTIHGHLLNVDYYQMKDEHGIPFRIVSLGRDTYAPDPQILRFEQFQPSEFIANL